MELVGQLAGGIAHDFNNVLSAIIMATDFLLNAHKPTDPSFGDIMQIKQNANRAASLVRHLLAFSRKQTLRPQVLDLGEVLSDLNSTVASAYGITFTLSATDQVLFLEVGNDLRKANGDSRWVLPAPATFVIATDGTIHHARVDPEYTERITAGEILSALRTITT